MAGIFGCHDYDKQHEKELNEYLDKMDEPEEEINELREVAITCLQLLANAAGATFEDEELAVDIIENTLFKTLSE